MSWLWFLLALFIDSIINYPLLKWSQRRYAGKEFNKVDVGIFAAFTFIITLWGAGMVLGAGSENRSDMMALWGVMIATYAAFFFLPLLIKRENGYKYANWLKLIGPIAAICLN